MLTKDDFIPCPEPYSTYRYPAIYKDTHEHIGSVLHRDYQVGDLLLFSNCTYEILRFTGDMSGTYRHFDVRRMDWIHMSDDIRLNVCETASCGIFRRRAGAPVVAAVKRSIDDGFNDDCSWTSIMGRE